MSFLSVKNRAESILFSTISSGAVELHITSGEGGKFPLSNFHITIDDEILLCTSRTGDVFTVERGKESTTAASHTAGAEIELRITAQIIQELQDGITAENLWDRSGTTLIPHTAGDSITIDRIWFNSEQSMYGTAGGALILETTKTGTSFDLQLKAPAGLNTTIMTPGGYYAFRFYASGNTIGVGRDIYPITDSNIELGSSTKYWANTYTDKLYFNATATLGGITAGEIKVTGNLVLGDDQYLYFDTAKNVSIHSGTANRMTLTASDRLEITGALSVYGAGNAIFRGRILPEYDSDIDLGALSKYWDNIFVNKIYLNATATLDGATEGRIIVSGTYLIPAVDDATRLGSNSKMYKTAFIKTIYLDSAGSVGITVLDGIDFYITSDTTTGGYVSPRYDSSYDLGASDKYWANTYTDKIYLNSTAILDGAAQAGQTTVTGHIVPSVNSNYVLGSASRTWYDAHIDKLYLNSTATLDGTVAGSVTINADIILTGERQISNSSGDLTLNAEDQLKLLLKDDRGPAFIIKDSSSSYYTISTTNEVAATIVHKFSTRNFSGIPSGPGAVPIFAQFQMAYLNYTGSTQITSLLSTVKFLATDIRSNAGLIIDKATTIEAVSPLEGPNVTITDASAIRILNTTGSPTNQYGIYIEDLTAGGSNYGIYIAGASTYAIFVDSGDVKFDDNLTVGGIGTFGDGTNQLEISATGDVVFVGGSGLAYGEISVKDNAVATILNSGAEVQLTVFNTNGYSNNTAPDQANNEITITKAGRYMITVSIHVNNNATQTHVIDVSLFKDNGSRVEFTNVHGHRTLTGGSGDVGSMSLSGIVDLAVDDELQIWATTGIAADRSVTFEDVTLTIVQIGG